MHKPITNRQMKKARGFSFVELMFAVVVLGIGFIMIAAVFPVGLQQVKGSVDETTAAGNVRGNMASLEGLAIKPLVPAYAAGTTASPITYTNGQYVTYKYKCYLCVSNYSDKGTATPDTSGNWQVQCNANIITPSLPFSFMSRGDVLGLGTRYPGIVRTLNDPRPFGDTVAGTLADMRRFTMWQSAVDQMISTSDARNGAALMYKRDAVGTNVVDPTTGAVTLSYIGASTAQVIVINTQDANTSIYTATDASNGLPAAPPRPTRDLFNLEPRPVAVQIIYDAGNQTWVATFGSVTKLKNGGAALGTNPAYTRGGYPTGNSANGNSWDSIFDAALGAINEGAFFVISDDRITSPAGSAGRMNGHIFRIGNRRPELGPLSFDLAPGYSFVPDPGTDGYLNSSSTPSTDDIVAIGVDSTGSSLTSFLSYTDKPFGNAGANGSSVRVAGTGLGQGAVALILGRGFTTPSVTPLTTDGYTGAAHDIAAYTTFLTLP